MLNHLPGRSFPRFHRSRLFPGNLEQGRSFHPPTILSKFPAVFGRPCQAGFSIPIVMSLKRKYIIVTLHLYWLHKGL